MTRLQRIPSRPLNLHRLWRVRSTLPGAASFVEKRLPPGAHREQRGSHGWTGIRADAIVGRCPCFHH